MKDNLIMDLISGCEVDGVVIGVNVTGEIEFRKLEEFTWLDNTHMTYQANFGDVNIKVYYYERDFYIIISCEDK